MLACFKYGENCEMKSVEQATLTQAMEIVPTQFFLGQSPASDFMHDVKQRT